MKFVDEYRDAALEFLAGIGKAYDDELAALQESRIE